MNDVLPLLIYDGNCGFCRIWIRYWQKLTGDRIRYAPSQEVGEQFHEISADAFRKSVWLVLPDGRRFSGAQAVFLLMELGAGRKWPATLYNNLPGFATLSELGYQLIARHRSLFYWITRFLWGKHIQPAASGLTRSLFLRGLAVTYFFAFASLLPQLIGLVGDNGLLPAHDVYPKFLFFNVNDAFLRVLPWIGIGLALMLFLRIVPMAAVAGLYVLYLTVDRIGQDFWTFQWDALLLEAGFAAILITPFGWRPSYRPSTSHIGIWTLRILIFRLMLESGLVKILSGDPTWKNWTALNFHYETQPLPTPLAWYAHHLPQSFQKLSCAGMFFVELVVPFLFLMPRKLRIVGAWMTIALQLVIAATGNYTFFNLLAIVLCVTLFDDQHLRRLLGRSGDTPDDRRRLQWRWATIPAGVLLIAVGLAQLLSMMGALQASPEVFPSLRIVNRYGLFAVMTTSRPEIVIEGSDDGLDWKPYEFKFKPGDVARPLRWVAPYQPRLDWQMWFAALGPQQNSPWFSRLMIRLLENSPDVERLLAKNPFPDKPPRIVRATLYDYRFSDASVRRQTGAIWSRTMLGEYFPAVQRR